jgi:hypothetical protein
MEEVEDYLVAVVEDVVPFDNSIILALPVHQHMQQSAPLILFLTNVGKSATFLLNVLIPALALLRPDSVLIQHLLHVGMLQLPKRETQVVVIVVQESLHNMH